MKEQSATTVSQPDTTVLATTQGVCSGTEHHESGFQNSRKTSAQPPGLNSSPSMTATALRPQRLGSESLMVPVNHLGYKGFKPSSNSSSCETLVQAIPPFSLTTTSSSPTPVSQQTSYQGMSNPVRDHCDLLDTVRNQLAAAQQDFRAQTIHHADQLATIQRDRTTEGSTLQTRLIAMEQQLDRVNGNVDQLVHQAVEPLKCKVDQSVEAVERAEDRANRAERTVYHMLVQMQAMGGMIGAAQTSQLQDNQVDSSALGMVPMPMCDQAQDQVDGQTWGFPGSSGVSSTPNTSPSSPQLKPTYDAQQVDLVKVVPAAPPFCNPAHSLLYARQHFSSDLKDFKDDSLTLLPYLPLQPEPASMPLFHLFPSVAPADMTHRLPSPEACRVESDDEPSAEEHLLVSSNPSTHLPAQAQEESVPPTALICPSPTSPIRSSARSSRSFGSTRSSEPSWRLSNGSTTSSPPERYDESHGAPLFHGSSQPLGWK